MKTTTAYSPSWNPLNEKDSEALVTALNASDDNFDRFENAIAKFSIRATRLLPDSWGISTVYADTKEEEDRILKEGLHQTTIDTNTNNK